MHRGYKHSRSAARERIPCDPNAERLTWSFLLVLTALGEQCLGLRCLGRLDLAKQSRDLVRGHRASTQQRLKGIDTTHLEPDQLGEDMHFHLSAIGGHG